MCFVIHYIGVTQWLMPSGVHSFVYTVSSLYIWAEPETCFNQQNTVEVMMSLFQDQELLLCISRSPKFHVRSKTALLERPSGKVMWREHVLKQRAWDNWKKKTHTINSTVRENRSPRHTPVESLLNHKHIWGMWLKNPFGSCYSNIPFYSPVPSWEMIQEWLFYLINF